jgi:hypothetical protein
MRLLSGDAAGAKLPDSATVKEAVADAEVEISRETAAAPLRTRVVRPDVRDEPAWWADSFQNELTT